MKIYVSRNGSVEFTDKGSRLQEHDAILILEVTPEDRIVAVKNQVEQRFSALIEETRTLRESTTLSGWLISGSVNVDRFAELSTVLTTDVGSVIECKLVVRAKKDAAREVGFHQVESTGRGETADEAFNEAFRKLRTWVL